MADNYAKVKSRKYASDDDAENLLAGILDETEDIAKAEQERIEAELRAKEAREAQKREEEERRKKEAAAAKLSAEMERLEKVEQRRTAKLEALKIEELKERGEWVDPEIERRKLEDQLRKEAEVAAMKAAAEAEARRKHAVPSSDPAMQAAAMPQAQAKSNLPIILAVVVALIGVLGAAGFVMMTGYQLDSAAYSKAVFAPKEQAVAMVEKGFTPLPKPEPVVVAEEEDDKPQTRRKSSNRKRVAAKSQKREPQRKLNDKPSENKASKKAKALEDALNTDIFGGGF